VHQGLDGRCDDQNEENNYNYNFHNSSFPLLSEIGETRRFRCTLHGPLSTINRYSMVFGNASQQDQREDDNYKPLHKSSFLSEPAPFGAELPGPTVLAESPLLAARASKHSSASKEVRLTMMTAFTQ